MTAKGIPLTDGSGLRIFRTKCKKWECTHDGEILYLSQDGWFAIHRGDSVLPLGGTDAKTWLSDRGHDQNVTAGHSRNADGISPSKPATRRANGRKSRIRSSERPNTAICRSNFPVKRAGATLCDRYSPWSLVELVGQPDAVAVLSEFLLSATSEAFLFWGGTGVGKSAAAKALARDLGTDVESGDIAGFHEVPSGNQDADAVRHLLRSLRLKPLFGSG